jgi:uncharacterized protein (TIGR03437 family)
VEVADASIGVFTADSSGAGQTAALNQDGQSNSRARPAVPGSVISVWATGVGQLSPPGVDGAVAEAGSVAGPIAQVLAWIGGEAAEVLYAGVAPGFLQGVIQVNLRIPDGMKSGDAAIVLKVGESVSQPGITVALGSP